MELRVEALPGCNLPTGCFVGVRVGEVLKQGRYDPGCCYRFPALERQRNAKIDLYQHIGTCNAIVDPETRANNEVKISGTEPSFADLRLKVSTQPEARPNKPREERKIEVKKQAKDFLGRHQVEERLCNAVKALLSAQPDDPTEFLVAHLRESCPKASHAAAAAKVEADAANTAVQDATQPAAAEATQKEAVAAQAKVETVPPPLAAATKAAAASAADTEKLRQEAKQKLINANAPRETEPPAPLPAEDSKATERASPVPPEPAAATVAPVPEAAVPAKSETSAAGLLTQAQLSELKDRVLKHMQAAEKDGTLAKLPVEMKRMDDLRRLASVNLLQGANDNKFQGI